MREFNRPRRTGQIIFGLVFILIGLLFLAENFDFYYIGSIWQFWPLFIIALGVSKLFNATSSEDLGGGAFWTIIGIWLLISTTHIWGLAFAQTWPLAIVAIGASMVIKSFKWREPQVQSGENQHGN